MFVGIFLTINLLEGGVDLLRRLQPFFSDLREAVEEDEAPGNEACDHEAALQVDRDDVQSGGLEAEKNCNKWEGRL